MTTTFTPEQTKHILHQINAFLTRPENAAALGGPSKAKCWACRIGLNAVIAGVIAAALISTDGFAAPVIAEIVQATGLSANVVAAIVGGAGATSVEAIIEELCVAMKACKQD